MISWEEVSDTAFVLDFVVQDITEILRCEEMFFPLFEHNSLDNMYINAPKHIYYIYYIYIILTELCKKILSYYHIVMIQFYHKVTIQ